MPMGEGPPRTTIPYIAHPLKIEGVGGPQFQGKGFLTSPDSFLHWTKPFRSVAGP